MFRPLKRSGHAALAAVLRLETADVFAVEKNATPAVLGAARQHVNERRLAGAVRADQAANFTASHRNVDAIESDETAETARQADLLEHKLGHRYTLLSQRRRTRPTIPCGIVRVTTTRVTPTMAGQYSANCPAASLT